MKGKSKKDDSGLSRREKALWTTSLGMSTLSLGIALASLDKKKRGGILGRRNLKVNRPIFHSLMDRKDVEPLQCPNCRKGLVGLSYGYTWQEHDKDGILEDITDYCCDKCYTYVTAVSKFKPVSSSIFLGDHEYVDEKDMDKGYVVPESDLRILRCPNCGAMGEEINDYYHHSFSEDFEHTLREHINCICKRCDTRFTKVTRYEAISRKFYTDE